MSWPFIWRNLKLLHPKMLCAKFSWNQFSGSGEKDFKILSMHFRYYVIINCKKDVTLQFKNIESPSTKDALCQVLLKLALWFWRKILNFINVFLLLRWNLKEVFFGGGGMFGWIWSRGSGGEDFKISFMYFRYFVIMSPWKRAWPFISVPFTKGCFVPCLVEICPVVLEKKIFQFRQYIFAVS